MKTFIALTLLLAFASGISMIALAFRADFRQLAADNGGDRTVGELFRTEFGMSEAGSYYN